MDMGRAPACGLFCHIDGSNHPAQGSKKAATGDSAQPAINSIFTFLLNTDFNF
jgi:hypothetical protein